MAINLMLGSSQSISRASCLLGYSPTKHLRDSKLDGGSSRSVLRGEYSCKCARGAVYESFGLCRVELSAHNVSPTLQ